MVHRGDISRLRRHSRESGSSSITSCIKLKVGKWRYSILMPQLTRRARRKVGCAHDFSSRHGVRQLVLRISVLKRTTYSQVGPCTIPMSNPTSRHGKIPEWWSTIKRSECTLSAAGMKQRSQPLDTFSPITAARFADNGVAHHRRFLTRWSPWRP